MARSLREWDIFQLKLARLYSSMSKDPSTKVGAIVCDSNSKFVYGMGFNGFPANVPDTREGLDNRDFKLTQMVHAETNALRLVGKHLDDLTMVIYPFLACLECAKEIIGSDMISRVVTLAYVPDRWRDSFNESGRMLLEAGIEVVKYDPMEMLHP